MQIQGWQSFQSAKALWHWISNLVWKCDDVLVVAHNIDYDSRLSGAFTFLPLAGFSPAKAIMSDTCTMFVWERGDGKVTLLDNMNLWQCSLADLGDSVGLPKLEIDFQTQDDAALETYCRRDVEILVRVWQRWLNFLDVHDLGSFAITVAGQAWNAYTRRFIPCRILIHDNPAAVGLERRAYHGGRTECFRIGKLNGGPYYKLDVNGLYAAMMKWYPYPRRLIKVLQNVRPDYLDRLTDDYLVIADVILSTETPAYPVTLSGRNAYPTGDFFATLSTPELQLALMSNDVVGVGKVAIYEGTDLFSEFIDYWTPLRQRYKQAGDVARSTMCKLIRNSLQGKFGQRGHDQEVIGDADLGDVGVVRWLDVETGATCEDWTFGGKTIRQTHQGEGQWSFPAIPAHVAAYGRVYMWSLIRAAGRDNVVYMDTDSLFVNGQGLDNLSGMIHNTQLGMLKVEGIATDVEIRAKKDYRFGDRNVRKGIRDNAVQLADNEFEQWHFTRLRYAFRAKCLDGVILNKVRKKLTYGNVAGTILSDGWVRPPKLTIDRARLWDARNVVDGPYSWVWEFDQDWLDESIRPAGMIPALSGVRIPDAPPGPADPLPAPPPLLDAVFQSRP